MDDRTNSTKNKQTNSLLIFVYLLGLMMIMIVFLHLSDTFLSS